MWGILLQVNTRNCYGNPHGVKLCLFTYGSFRKQSYWWIQQKKKTGKNPLTWLCYIHIIFIWTQDKKSLSRFFSFADSFTENYTMKSHIKFETHVSTTNVNLHDAKITSRNGKLIYSIYCKPSDAHLYLNWTFCQL